MERHHNNVILGGGISGLIGLHYIKDSILFEAQDSLAKDFLDNVFPKFIHYNDRTESLFEELDLNVKVERFNVGIYEDGKIYDFFNDGFPEEKRQDVYNKYCLKKYGKIVEGKMNGYLSGNFERNYIENKFDLINKIKDTYSDRIALNHRVDKIDTKNKEVYFNNDLFLKTNDVSYDKLISTIPLNFFSRLADAKFTFKDIHLKLASVLIEDDNKLESLDDWNFIYVTDDYYDFHRIIINKGKGCIIYEFNNDVQDMSQCVEFTKKFYSNVGAYSFREFKFNVLKDNKTEIYIPDVYFLGRFSTGNYAVKIEEVVDGARSVARDIRDSEENKQ